MIQENKPAPEIARIIASLKNNKLPEVFLFLILGLVGLVLMAGYLYLPKTDDLNLSVAITGGVISFFSFFLVPVLYFKGRSVLKENRDLLSGKNWLHWIYTPAETKQSNQEAWENWKKGFGIALVVFGLMVALAAAGITHYLRSKFIEGPLGLLGSVGPLVAFGLAAGLIFFDRWKKAAPSAGGSTQVFINRKGAYWTSTGFQPFLGTLAVLELEPTKNGLSNLVFKSVVKNSQVYNTSNPLEFVGPNLVPVSERILIPAGKEEEAAQLIERFQAGELPD